MGIGNLPNPPTPGQPVASAWGNAVSVRVVQAYANKAQLDAVWNDAPEGAIAVTTDTFSLWQRRTGVWAKPLALPLGLVLPQQAWDTAKDVTIGGAGIWYTDQTFGPFALAVNRVYQISWSARWENKTAPGVAVIGGDVAAASTGDDVPIDGGIGQQALVYGQTLQNAGAAWRGSVSGFFHTRMAGGGSINDVAPVTISHRYIGTAGTWNVSLRRFSIVDLGPYSG